MAGWVTPWRVERAVSDTRRVWKQARQRTVWRAGMVVQLAGDEQEAQQRVGARACRRTTSMARRRRPRCGGRRALRGLKRTRRQSHVVCV
jgi:hypothetical protein